ncbi:MAG: 7-carboxy-7-deazaguanine synthase QueE [Armatimonadetes bacterium]|nr:7-carboxy-7-deazaguanine synthase QueE [Armatimonadota bacterium]
MKGRIAETFLSLQGEGIWAGTPSFFIRFSGCNLRCRWCDTPYASWKPEGPIREIEEVAAEAIKAGSKHIVITGGEPMLFDAIEPLATSLRAAGKVITIETAGTVFRQVECDLMSISPKLSNSDPELSEDALTAKHRETRKNVEPLRRLIGAYDYQLKFVVAEAGDLPEILELQRALKAPSERILLMPEGTESEKLADTAKKLTPICIEHGFRLSPRLHIDLFGNTRGT